MRNARTLVVLTVCALVFVGALVGLVATVASSEPAPAEPQVSVDVHVVPEVMTAVYKVYGGDYSDRWLARTAITNTGSAPIRDFRIEYKVPGYVETTSAEEYPLILPGQTVRDYCYPIFDPDQMADIDSETSAELVVTYECDGMDRPVTTTERFDFLGHNEWVRTSIPDEERLVFHDWGDNDTFLAAFVTAKDPEVQAYAKQLTGGLFTANDDEAIEALGRIYYGLRDAGYKYVTEPDSFWTEESAQHVQFPRETMAHRGGNCVDLSVLFASMLEAVGVKTYLTLSPGHCQLCIELPEKGTIIPVEATLVDDPNSTLQQSFDSAWEWYQQHSAENMFTFMDVEQAWREGMVPTW